MTELTHEQLQSKIDDLYAGLADLARRRKAFTTALALGDDDKAGLLVELSTINTEIASVPAQAGELRRLWVVAYCRSQRDRAALLDVQAADYESKFNAVREQVASLIKEAKAKEAALMGGRGDRATVEVITPDSEPVRLRQEAGRIERDSRPLQAALCQARDEAAGCRCRLQHLGATHAPNWGEVSKRYALTEEREARTKVALL